MTKTLNLGDDMTKTFRLTRDILNAEAIAQDHRHSFRTFGDEDYLVLAKGAEREVRRLTLELERLQEEATR